MTALSAPELVQLREVLDDQAARKTMTAIRQIPVAQLSEGVVALLIRAIAARVEADSNWKHTDLAKFTAACLADTASELEVGE